MKPTFTSDDVKQALALIVQLGGLVGAAGILIQTLSGALDSPYAQTLSVLAALIITLLLWIWRWPRISQVKSRSGTSRKGRHGTSLDEHFRQLKTDAHVMSLSRRRAEGALLFSVSVLFFFFSVSKIQSVVEEISGLSCDYAPDKGAPVIVLATFNNMTDVKTAFVNRLHTGIAAEFGEDVTLCRSRILVTVEQEAEHLAQQANHGEDSTIVIWGDSDDRLYEIHVTLLQWSAFEQIFTADMAASGELEQWARRYLPTILQGEISFMQGDQRKAIRVFEDVTQSFEQESWSEDNAQTLAGMYLLLAHFLEEDGQFDPALSKYSLAIHYNESLDLARLKRGELSLQVDRDQAFRDFNELIQRDSDFASEAYFYRASLQDSWASARSDYENAIALSPTDTSYYEELGLAALHHQDFDTAYRAFETSLAYLDAETRDYFVEDLNYEVQENSLPEEDAQRIIDLLVNAKLK